MIPAATGRPACAASSILGKTPTPTTTRSAGTCRPSLRLTPVTLTPSLSMPVACTPRWMRMPGRGVPVLEKLRDFRGHRARHDPRAEFDHIDLKALGARGGGKFQADEPGPDHDDALARCDPLPQRLALIERPQITHVLEIGVGDVEQPVARAGGQHQMPIIERRAGCEQEPPRRAIDRDRAIGDQLDVLVAVKFVRPEHQAVGTRPRPSDRPWTKAAADTADAPHR